MKEAPTIHLVTYATPQFRHRQWFLGLSARANHVVDNVTSWTPSRLMEQGFGQRAPEIELTSRGSGFWAWKPFIIEWHLNRVRDGDIVFYCDVGRHNGFKLLESSINSLIGWMDQNKQDMLPGLLIPWKGPMSMWTKRNAFVLTGMDSSEAHQATPIQASFSIWRASGASRDMIGQWMNWCAQPQLINDERGDPGFPELQDFVDHRHDQSLLTLCCLNKKIQGLDLGSMMPPIDTQHPCEVNSWLQGSNRAKTSWKGLMVRTAALPFEMIEKGIRRTVRIGEPPPTST